MAQLYHNPLYNDAGDEVEDDGYGTDDYDRDGEDEEDDT